MARIKPAEIKEIFETFANDNPNPQTELIYTNPYTLLVAVVLSAQATDVGVNKATKPLFEKISSPDQMVKLGEEALKSYIKTIGLFNSKARNIIALSKMLLAEFDGKIPKTREDLMRLPGVGRKTANVVLQCAFGEPTIAVDTHVFRVSNRIGIADAKDELETELQLLKRIPVQFLPHAHHWLILHGRYVCKARNPLCLQCNIAKYCRFSGKVL